MRIYLFFALILLFNFNPNSVRADDSPWPKPPKGWLSLPPLGPSRLLLTNLNGPKAQLEDNASLSVQVFPTQKSVLFLKRRLENPEGRKHFQVKKGELIGYSRQYSCHQLLIKQTTNFIEQTWCFGEKQSVVIVEKGLERLPSQMRRQIILTAKRYLQ